MSQSKVTHNQNLFRRIIMNKRFILVCTLMVTYFIAFTSCIKEKRIQQGEDELLPEWALGNFIRPAKVNPIISPRNTEFFCPMRKEMVKWEESDTFNPAATVKDGKIVVLYRAEDNSAQGIGKRTSRIGYAESVDGINMKLRNHPVLFPDEDEYKSEEWEGGCEDPRVAMTEDGLYVMLYTAWNRDIPRLSVATSRDLVNWEKHGLAFAKAYDGRFATLASKSASIVTKLKGDKLVIEKVNRKYFMYWGENAVYAATSDNLIDWEPVLDENNELKKIAEPRNGFFDSRLTECGPPALKTKHGIVLLYNGKNEMHNNGGDINYPAGAYCAGQFLFDASNPYKVLGRLDKPFLSPEAAFEKSGQYRDGTVFIEGLAYLNNKYYLYYGCADSKVAVAIFDSNK